MGRHLFNKRFSRLLRLEGYQELRYPVNTLLTLGDDPLLGGPSRPIVFSLEERFHSWDDRDLQREMSRLVFLGSSTIDE